MLRFRVNCIRGTVEGEGDYELRLGLGARGIEMALFNGSSVKAWLKAGIVRVSLHGKGGLEMSLR